MIRVILPIVIENEEKKIAELTGSTPDRFQCEPAIFYSIDNIRPYYDYTNLCVIDSGGCEYIVGLSMEEVDEMIMGDVSFAFSAN